MSEKNSFPTLQVCPLWGCLGGAKLLTSSQHTSEIQEHPAPFQQMSALDESLPHSSHWKATDHLRIHLPAYKARKRAGKLSLESLTFQALARLW